MLHLAFSNIRFRVVRSLISIFAVSVAITMLLILIGLTQGTINELVNRIKKVGADIIVQPSDGTFFMALKSAVISGEYTEQFKQIEGVQTVVPVVTWLAKMNRQMHVVYGINLKNFRALSGRNFELVDGRVFSDTDDTVKEILIDDRLCATNGYKVGDEIRLFGKKFNLVGIYKQGIGARILMPAKKLQEKLDRGNKYSFFYIKCNSTEDVQRVSKIIEERFKDVRVNVSTQIEEIVKKTLSGLNDFVGAVSIVALFISSLVVLLTMYTTVLERTREIGIMKALGATNFFIAGNVVLESVILSSFGVGMGGGFFFLSRHLFDKIYPLLTIELSLDWLLIALGIGVFVGMIGSLFPAYLAARQDPVKALRYE